MGAQLLQMGHGTGPPSQDDLQLILNVQRDILPLGIIKQYMGFVFDFIQTGRVLLQATLSSKKFKT